MKELQRFLGMVNYLEKLPPNLSDVSAPLRKLLKKDMWRERERERERETERERQRERETERERERERDIKLMQAIFETTGLW